MLRERALLGRAGDCDIQIINDGVSRQHAKVIESESGHMLIDLGSNNGTFISDVRVNRHRLVEGDEFRIMRSRFVYEPIPEGGEDEQDAGVWAAKVVNGRTLRQTVDQMRVPDRLPPARGDTQDDVAAKPAGLSPPGAQPSGLPPSGSQQARAVARIIPREPERHALAAVRPDGRPYSGDLVGDILVFRDLQLRMVRQEQLLPVEQGLLQRFASAFAQPETGDPSPFAGLRRFVRFRCRFPARVRWISDGVEHTAAVMVQDLGVGGARLAWRQHSLRVGIVAWLVIDMVVRGRARTLVFPTRVAWASGPELGLQFAGVAEWERGGGG
ncbi:MAG: FHA domain-containing protein [Deltaproteobacteria bacterium]|nr:FHA domain-containing protein [Deltaproteobacteria bacterium]